jgi:hypothetical protein
MAGQSDSSWGWLLVVIFAAILISSALDRSGGPASGDVSGTPFESRGGSAMACEVPLSWHIARLDPDFGLDPQVAERAVREAAAIWEGSTARTLFPNSAGEGVAIHFVFDERQATAGERSRNQARIERADEDLDRRRASLDREAARLDQDIARHNEAVEEWNAAGGASPTVLEELSARELLLQERQREVNSRIDDLNHAVAERNRQFDRLAEQFPSEAIESGTYAETVHRRGQRVTSVTDREIRIYRFDDWDDLVLVIAHEFGHALGLGHATSPEAVMASVHSRASPQLHSTDLSLLRDRCPDLR